MLDPATYLATLSLGGRGGDTLLYSNLKVIAVPVLATILHTAPLRFLNELPYAHQGRSYFNIQHSYTVLIQYRVLFWFVMF